jgi:hypothetical protein
MMQLPHSLPLGLQHQGDCRVQHHKVGSTLHACLQSRWLLQTVAGVGADGLAEVASRSGRLCCCLAQLCCCLPLTVVTHCIAAKNVCMQLI